MLFLSLLCSLMAWMLSQIADKKTRAEIVDLRGELSRTFESLASNKAEARVSPRRVQWFLALVVKPSGKGVS